MLLPDVTELTRKFIQFQTVNPPGSEAALARYAGDILGSCGFLVNYIPYGENRLHLVAQRGCSVDTSSVLFSGHFDTVPFGAAPWQMDPLAGEVVDGKIFGRGSSDMKGGLAAMIIAAVAAFDEGAPEGGVQLLLTAGEETGCQGAAHLVSNYNNFYPVRGVIVGEPTANQPAIGHKGGLYLNLSAKGRTAHSSMPHLGENAIYKAAHAILKAETFDFKDRKDPLLGHSTLNVGKMSGGINLNSVPDYAEFTIDARTTSLVSHQELLQQLKDLFGTEINIEVLVNLPAVASSEKDPFVHAVYRACNIRPGDDNYPRALPYLTDGAVLQSAFNGAPTIILGPGQPEMAHKTDEFCLIKNLEDAVTIYKKIILDHD